MTEDYSDIINMPHHVSASHQQMSMEARAAQFAPFAALTGHSEAINEAARQTCRKISPGEYYTDRLNRKMALLKTLFPDTPVLDITFFKPDSHKSGGYYHTITGTVRIVDDVRRLIIMSDGVEIPLSDIIDIGGLDNEDE